MPNLEIEKEQHIAISNRSSASSILLCLFEARTLAERRIENFLADAQALGRDFQKLVRIDEIERLLKA